MARFADLLPEARIGLASAPDLSIEAALRRGTQRLLRDSQLWTADLDPFALAAGVDTYDLEPDLSRAVVEKLLVVKVGGNRLAPARLVDLRALTSGEGTPTFAALTVDGRQIVLHPAPDLASVGRLVRVHAALTLVRSAREFPDFLADEWHDAIVAAAHAEMYGNRAMPWYDPQKALERELRYSEEAARAKRKQHSGGHVSMFVAPRPWI